MEIKFTVQDDSIEIRGVASRRLPSKETQRVVQACKKGQFVRIFRTTGDYHLLEALREETLPKEVDTVKGEIEYIKEDLRFVVLKTEDGKKETFQLFGNVRIQFR